MNKVKKLFLWVITLVVFGIFCAPEAPHDNILDPYRNGGNAKGIEFFGEVLQKSEPHLPVKNCKVFLLPEQKFDTTNTVGRFYFTEMVPGIHQLIIEKGGFTTDTFFVDPDTVSGNPTHFFLNGEPYIEAVKIFSEFIDQWWPEPIAYVNTGIKVGDPDGVSDLQNVTFQVPAFNLAAGFQETSVPDSFFLQLNEQFDPNIDLRDLIGKEIRIVLTDNSGARVVSQPYFLIRLNENSPETVEPTGLQIVEGNPVFKWVPYNASFTFHYEISVFFVNAGIPLLIHNKQKISPDTLQYQYPDSLSSGTYFWTVGVRDNLGNLSRSKEASFLVP